MAKMELLKRLAKKWRSVTENSHPRSMLSLKLLEPRLLLSVEYSLINLGTLGGDYSLGMGLNDNGQVVGQATTDTGGTVAFVWEEGVMSAVSTGNGAV